MNTFDIAFIIVSTFLLFVLVGLVIKEREHLFIENAFRKKKRKNNPESYFVEETKKLAEPSVKNGHNYLDFSGGDWGI